MLCSSICISALTLDYYCNESLCQVTSTSDNCEGLGSDCFCDMNQELCQYTTWWCHGSGSHSMMHRWLSGSHPDQSGVSGHHPYHPALQSDHISKSNSYHGEPYIPADVFNVSMDINMASMRLPSRCIRLCNGGLQMASLNWMLYDGLWSSFSANDLN